MVKDTVSSLEIEVYRETKRQADAAKPKADTRTS
jgi:hypothetical protein